MAELERDTIGRGIEAVPTGLGVFSGRSGRRPLALWCARSEAKRVRRRLKSATTSLERLHLSFAHFAPQEVAERIVASDVSMNAEKKTVTVLFARLTGGCVTLF